MSVEDITREYNEDGYGIVRGLLSPQTVSQLTEEADRLHALGADHETTTDDGLVKWLVAPGRDSSPTLRGLQNGYRISTLLDAVRAASSTFSVLRPFLGDDIDSVINTLFWKEPGQPNTAIAYHQDAVFRKPAERYRNLASSYLQVGIALDPHGPANGGMRVVVGSHLNGDMSIQRTSSVMTEPPDAAERYGLQSSQELDLDLAPGDAVYWHPFLLHGSPPNQSRTLNRRFLVNGYMRSVDCDGGTPAFRQGRPRPWQS